MGNGAFMAGSGGFREAKRALTWHCGGVTEKLLKTGSKHERFCNFSKNYKISHDLDVISVTFL